MRLFGSEKIAGVMDKMGFKEGEVIESSMISRAIERAQRKVEENHYGVRKRLLEYDDVMNAQRDVIYKQRRETLHGERMGVNIMNKIFDTVAGIVEDNRDSANYAQFKEDLLRSLSVDTKVDEETFKVENEQKLAESVFAESMEAFKRKTAKIAETAYACHQEGL
jgi:preprotein translocase subunit SecA